MSEPFEVPKHLEKKLEEVAKLMNMSVEEVATLALKRYLEKNAKRLIEEAALKNSSES